MAKNLNQSPYLDRTNFAECSSTGTTAGGTITITGSSGNVKDKNTSTYYEVFTTDGTPPKTASVQVDFGNVFWNCQLSLIFKLNSNAGNTGNLEYSIDGTN